MAIIRHSYLALLGVGALIVGLALPASAAPGPIYNDHYSGYVTPPGAYTAVGAIWTVPTLDCLRSYPFPYVLQAGGHQWVGLGGVSGGPPGSVYADVNSTPLVQDGIVSQCLGGFQSNHAFWEVVPGNLAQTFKGKEVKPGDQVGTSVIYLGSGQYEMDMANLSKAYGWTARAYYTVGDAREGTTAEWIIEPGQPAVPLFGVRNYPLADFGTVTFNASYSTDTHHGIYLGGTYSVTPVKFIQGTSRSPKVSVSAVTPPGGEFSVTYLTKRHIK